MSLRLISLDCHRCGSAMRAEATDVIFICDHCGAGAVLESEGGLAGGDSNDTQQLVPIDAMALMPAPGRRAELWRPAWLIEARVRVEDRVTADQRPTAGSDQRRRFIVPAFTVALGDLCALARALSAAAGAWAKVPNAPVTGGTLRLGDAMQLVRHLVTGEEVHKPDLLATLRVTIEPSRHALVAVPFQRSRSGLICAVSGARLREFA